MIIASAALTAPPWMVLPFAALLLAIAVLPLVAPHWWHSNRNKAIVAGVLGGPCALWIARHDAAVLGHTALEYGAFVALLGSLFVIAGGISIRGRVAGSPLSNTVLLALGAVLANFIGTTGASMLLIRPFLRANRHRRNRVHLVVFFIFSVSNVGGCLTPLGDPPLFLGFLRGVPFTWTLTLWQPWAAALGAILVVFFIFDSLRAGKEPPPEAEGPISMSGGVNFVFLAGVIGAVLAAGKWVLPEWGETPMLVFQMAAMGTLAGLSLMVSPKAARAANEFVWAPLIEVAVLFAGIFCAMIPALALLQEKGSSLGVREPWHFFWATGSLSAVLDNAPTYLAFLSAAQFLPDEVVGTSARALAAISCGAVFFGAMTYIGNGPNFMVKAIAEQSGVRMPSFVGYIAWSAGILLPIFVALTLLFFR